MGSRRAIADIQRTSPSAQARADRIASDMRGVLTILSLFVLFSVAIDPYTLRKTSSDLVEHAPLWQLSLGLLNLVLLGALVLFIWHRRILIASRVLLGETLFNIGVAVILLHRDGVNRFIMGFSGQEILSIYLIAIAVRVVMLSVLASGYGLGAPLPTDPRLRG